MSCEDEKQDVEFAFRVLEFAIRTMCYFELGEIDVARFGQHTTIRLEEENVNFDDEYFVSQDNAILVSQLNVGAAFGVSAIALDNFFETVRTHRHPSSDEPTEVLWALVYAVRNAFAHGIANPLWVIKKNHQRILNIPLQETEIIVDLAKLNGSEFAYAHIGGFANWTKIKDQSFKLLEAP